MVWKWLEEIPNSYIDCDVTLGRPILSIWPNVNE